MPFRERIKRVLTRRSSSATSSNPSTPSDASRRNSNIFQPGDKMPIPKYRRPVAPEHKAHLEAFSWGNAWRRHSGASQYSPMGSRMPSRKNSTAAQARRSHQAVRPPPVGSALARDAESAASTEHLDSSTLSHQLSKILSADPDDMSTSDGSSSDRMTVNDSLPLPNQPWTQEELTLALARSNIAVPP